jgi:Fic family protein
MAGTDSRAGGMADVAAVDALYRPFADFAGWGRLGTDRRELWSRFSTELDQQKQLVTGALLERAVMVAVRAAAIDTGAIEGLYQVDRGFTMTVAFQAFAWQQALAERGAGVRELFEAQLAGYELAIDAVTGQTPISEAWLRSLHERICASQSTYRVLTEMGVQEQPLPKGRYKEHPNHVLLADGTHHAYAPVADTAPEMHRFVEQLRTAAFEEAHPVEQAAYAHYALTAAHPFADGNGRVARALASVYLYKSLSIPLVVFANQRRSYFDVLARADDGDPGPWLAFVADRGIDTMQLVVENLRSAKAMQPDEIAEKLGALFSPRGRTPAELDSLALRLLGEAQDRWQAALAQLDSRPGGVSIRRQVMDQDTPPGYRPIGGRSAPWVSVILETPAPFSFSSTLWFTVNIAVEDRNLFGFQLEASGAADRQDRLEVRDADLAPELSDVLKGRLDQWIRRQLSRLLAEVDRQVKAALDKYRA